MNKDIIVKNDKININKKENNINIINKEKLEKKENKEKEKSKGYSKALDRFKKRFKNSNSMEIRPKKSEKINEIAKRLENIMGKPQTTEGIENNQNNTYEIIHYNNSTEIIENQPVNINKTKKAQRPQI